jgi:hypothetical protein
MLNKALPLSLSESADIVNGSFASQKTAKFLQKSTKFDAFYNAILRVYHLRINHKPRVGRAHRSLTNPCAARNAPLRGSGQFRPCPAGLSCDLTQSSRPRITKLRRSEDEHIETQERNKNKIPG